MARYGLLNYSYDMAKCINLGDHIQSLAAKQFLPKEYQLVDRESLDTYSGERVKVIMNGWFLENPRNFPPAENIEPLYLSIHLNKELTFSPKTIDHLQRHAPIGCRDIHTLKLCRKYKIEAYFSGCLTLALKNKYQEEKRENNVLFVDAGFRDLDPMSREHEDRAKANFESLYAVLQDHVPKEMLANSKKLTHRVEKGLLNDEECFERAFSYLDAYARAGLVVTSRLHAALPCLALKTPVIFVNDLGNNPRFGGITNLFNTIYLSTNRVPRSIFGRITNLFPPINVSTNRVPHSIHVRSGRIVNPNDYLLLVPELERRCHEFVK